MLKNAVVTAINEPDIAALASEALSRAIRDISAEEAKFIVNNYRHSKLTITSQEFQGDFHVIRPDSSEEILMSGLISIGLLFSKAPYHDIVIYEWSPLVAKLVKLLIVRE